MAVLCAPLALTCSDEHVDRCQVKPVQSHSELHAIESKEQPFTFAAVASKNLIRGELISFYVDATGKITADKLDFIQASLPRLLKKPADA